MRVAFFGFQTWGLVSLRAIQQSNHNVVLVVTHEPSNAPYASSFTESIEDYSHAQSLPVVVAKIAEEQVVRAALVAAAPDLIVSSNWRRKMAAETLTIPSKGGINVHRSLLPKYGGMAPINWAIAKGEQRTGVTIHRMDAELDLGSILAQEGLTIGPDETATSVFNRMTPVIVRLLPDVLTAMEKGTLKERPQDASELTLYHQRGEREFTIDWSRSADEVYNLIRAQSDPFPSARTTYRGEPLFIHTARRGSSRFRGTPGRLVAREPDGVVALCGQDAVPQAIVITTVSVSNGPPQPAHEILTQLGEYLGH